MIRLAFSIWSTGCSCLALVHWTRVILTKRVEETNQSEEITKITKNKDGESVRTIVRSLLFPPSIMFTSLIMLAFLTGFFLDVECVNQPIRQLSPYLAVLTLLIYYTISYLKFNERYYILAGIWLVFNLGSVFIEADILVNETDNGKINGIFEETGTITSFDKQLSKTVSNLSSMIVTFINSLPMDTILSIMLNHSLAYLAVKIIDGYKMVRTISTAVANDLFWFFFSFFYGTKSIIMWTSFFSTWSIDVQSLIVFAILFGLNKLFKSLKAVKSFEFTLTETVKFIQYIATLIFVVKLWTYLDDYRI